MPLGGEKGKEERGKNGGGEGSRRTAGNSSTVSSFSSDYHTMHISFGG